MSLVSPPFLINGGNLHPAGSIQDQQGLKQIDVGCNVSTTKMGSQLLNLHAHLYRQRFYKYGKLTTGSGSGQDFRWVGKTTLNNIDSWVKIPLSSVM